MSDQATEAPTQEAPDSSIDVTGSQVGDVGAGDVTYDPTRQVAAPTTVMPDFLTLVAEQAPEYKDTEWVKNTAKSENWLAETLKQRSELEKAMHNRPGIPGPDATPEQIQAFNKSIGVPDDIKGYEYKGLEFDKLGLQDFDKPIVEYLNASREGPLFEAMKGFAHKASLTPAQFNEMAQGYEMAMIASHRDELVQAHHRNQDANTKVNDFMAKRYGANAEAEAAKAGAFLKNTLPPELHADLPNLTPQEMGRVAVYVREAMKQYVQEDSTGAKGAEGMYSQGKTVTELSEEGIRLMLDPDFNSPGAARYDELHRKHNEVYAQQRALLAAQQK